MVNPNDPQSSRSRLLHAGKTLFSKHGYEQTTTSAIARDAGTSESQLVRFFGGKAGLLEAIFNEAWPQMIEQVHVQISNSAHGREAIVRTLNVVTATFARDPEIALLFLFEGRRVRNDAVNLSRGFREFYDMLCALIKKGQEDKSFRDDVEAPSLASAMLGAAEGMIRDRMMAQRSDAAHAFSETSMRKTFEAIVNGLAPTQ